MASSGSFYEHSQAIQNAIRAARDDGHKLLTDLQYDRDGMVDLIQLDLWSEDAEQEYVTVFEEKWQ